MSVQVEIELGPKRTFKDYRVLPLLWGRNAEYRYVGVTPEPDGHGATVEFVFVHGGRLGSLKVDVGFVDMSFTVHKGGLPGTVKVDLSLREDPPPGQNIGGANMSHVDVKNMKPTSFEDQYYDEYEYYNLTDKYAEGSARKGRTKKEASENTNRHNPAGHERKIVEKLQNSEKKVKE